MFAEFAGTSKYIAGNKYQFSQSKKEPMSLKVDIIIVWSNIYVPLLFTVGIENPK